MRRDRLSLENSHAVRFCRLFLMICAVMFFGCTVQWIVWLVSHSAGETVGWISFRWLFFESGNDCFMDFFNSIRDAAQGLAAYTERHIIYPPLANFFYFLIAKAMPSWYVNTSFDDRGMAQSHVPLLLLAIVVDVLFALTALWLLRCLLKDRPAWERYLFLFVFELSFPFLYLFERGNILLLTFVLVLVFLVFGDSPSRTRRELALLALAAAAALKLYPAIFALFLLRDKRYRELGRVILYFLLLSVLPTFFFGGPVPVFSALLSNLFDFTQYKSTAEGGFSGSTPLTGCISLLGGLFGFQLSVPSVLKWVLVAVPVLAFILCFFLSKTRFFSWLSLFGVLLSVPGVGSLYLLIFAFIPLFFFFQEEEELSHTVRALALVFFFLVLLPLPIGIRKNLSLSAMLSALLALPLVLFLCIFETVNRLRAYRKESL